MNTWLDSETRSILQNTPPVKLAPAKAEGFTLVLLSIYRHHPDRLVRAVKRIRHESTAWATAHLSQKMPMALKHELDETEALLGQFELICCDAISVFICDDVVKYGSREYLIELYNTLLRSNEFVGTDIVVELVPDTESGVKFVDQFLGTYDQLKTTFTVPYKKARVMMHWGDKIGARIRYADEANH